VILKFCSEVKDNVKKDNSGAVLSQKRAASTGYLKLSLMHLPKLFWNMLFLILKEKELKYLYHL
jgi:hypothetical protein